MPVRAKICGITTEAALDAAIVGGASHVGFVFYDKSPRNLMLDRAAALAARVPAHIRKVGVFAKQDSVLFQRAISAAGLHILQLHGTDPRQAAAERALTGRSIWGLVQVKAAADLRAAADWGEAVDRIVYDARTPVDAELPGGMGVRFDWSLLDGFGHPRPWVLAGGLDADNVAEAVRRTNATFVDVSSGVESAPGVKDVDKIAAFLQAVARL